MNDGIYLPNRPQSAKLCVVFGGVYLGYPAVRITDYPVRRFCVAGGATMTRRQFTTVLILSLLAVCACGVNSGAYVHTSVSVNVQPPWYPVARYVFAAVQVEPLQVIEKDGHKALP